MDAPETPMCEHLKEKEEDLDILQDFLMWLQEEGLHICEETEDDTPHFILCREKNRELAYRFLGIDEDKLEEERRELLEYQRELNS